MQAYHQYGVGSLPAL